MALRLSVGQLATVRGMMAGRRAAAAFATRALRAGIGGAGSTAPRRCMSGVPTKAIKGEFWELKPKEAAPPRPIQTLFGTATPDEYKNQRYHCQWLKDNGRVPCVVLHSDPLRNQKEKITFSLKLTALQKEMAAVGEGFTNQVYMLQLNDREEPLEVICTNKQIDSFTRNPISLQFLHFEEGHSYNVDIPVKIDGIEDCPALKQGGILLTPIDHIKARWRGGKMIPQAVTIDMSEVGLRTVIKTSDLEARGEWPSESLTPRKKHDYVLVTIKGKAKAVSV